MAGKRKSTSKAAPGSASSSKQPKKARIAVQKQIEEVEEEEFVLDVAEEMQVEEEEAEEEVSRVKTSRGSNSQAVRKTKDEGDEESSRFVGEPVPVDEAHRRWPHRYIDKIVKEVTSATLRGTDEKNLTTQARLHFTQAEVDGKTLFKLGDDAYVMGEEGQPHFICRIVEMFEGQDGSPFFTAQWFYRAEDTVIQNCSDLIDKNRVFLSKIKDDNPLDCLVEKLRIVQLPLDVDLAVKSEAVSKHDYYYDMQYLVPFSSFLTLPTENAGAECESDSTVSSVSEAEVSEVEDNKKSEMSMLDLYSGCGAMSTGLCLGANLSGVNLITKWAVDLSPFACKSLKLNHPETEVRNETVDDFLMLLKEWEKLCVSYSLIRSSGLEQQSVDRESCEDKVKVKDEVDDDGDDDEEGEDTEIFEVEEILSICFGDPNKLNKRGLYFKIRWKGYGSDEDTWEPLEGLSECPDKLKEFVVNGYESKILPLPGQADVICGGPPCQGISGFNRFRKKDKPLEDEKNKQLLVYMNVVEYLKPKFVLMENVVDILKFAKGFLGRYALGRLVGMNYQARVGLIAAGAYGLPQFRMRMFMWAALSTEKLPQYPLPTHNVIARGGSPVEFESNTVVYDDPCGVELEKELYLGDAISDLPPVENDEARDEMPYGEGPKTDFQRFIRLRKDEMPGFSTLRSKPLEHPLYDHRPLCLNKDDHDRVCQIPKRKGANFRDLKGVRVKDDNTVEWDPEVPRVYLGSGKPLIPDYAMSFIEGRSLKPFGRLWWDETVPTVVTRAEPHNQVILHPVQNRVLSIRENARLQGFPDYYKLVGPVKERYIQVGNAVAVPVARALGYSLGLASKGASFGEEPLLTLPKKFPHAQEDRLLPSLED